MSNPPASSPTQSIFQPTLGRVLFALVLATVGFLLPQEVPLVWYPLNEPGMDINYLEISCAANANGQVQIFYNTGNGTNELDSIRWPISPTDQTYTYTFPLPDAPITELKLTSITNGGTLTIRQMRIIDRRGVEMRRFTREMFVPLGNIAAIHPLPDGWEIVSESNARTPALRIEMDAPILAKGINHRNFLRCLYSSSYLTLMLWILLLAVLFTFYRPKSWRDAASHLGFMALLALMFSLVGNRGLIKNSLRYSRFVPPPIAPDHFLEIDLRIDHPLTAQLFWDVGRGMNESDSIRQKYETHTSLQTLSFPLPATRIKALRFDPIDGHAQLTIRGIRVVDRAERTLLSLPLGVVEGSQDIAGLKIDNDLLKVETSPTGKDPILMFTSVAVANIDSTLDLKQ